MKGNQRVIDGLNSLLAMELAAMDQYFIHSRMYDDWGLSKLFARIDHEVDDEKGHAALLIERMLFLEGTPNMVTREGLKIGSNVEEMIESDLRIEYEVGNRLKEVIKICEEEQDYQSREILQKLLEDTEVDHAHWLEQQLRLIKMLGIENYLQSQM
jgi:bacterioferritin